MKLVSRDELNNGYWGFFFSGSEEEKEILVVSLRGNRRILGAVVISKGVLYWGFTSFSYSSL
jgi:hypothetical protein